MISKVTNNKIDDLNDTSKSSILRGYIETNVIVGFPRETKEESKKSIEFIGKADIDYGVIFPYSLKNGTKAGLIEPTVPT